MTMPQNPPASGPGPTPPYYPPPPPKSNALRNAVSMIAVVVIAILVLAYAVPRILISTPPPSCPSGTVGTYPNCTAPPSPAAITVTQTSLTRTGGCLFGIAPGTYEFSFTLVNTGDRGGTARIYFYLNGAYVDSNTYYVSGHSSVSETQMNSYGSCSIDTYDISLVSVT